MDTLTIDELINTLKHSSIPTILVEGRDDMTVYQWIEKRLGTLKANIIPCNGKDRLLQLYNRRNEFSNINVAFLADSDMWLFCKSKKKIYKDIIFTKGYSIENDIINSHCIHNLLSESEKISFEKFTSVLSTWFAFEVEQYLSNTDLHGF